MASQVTSGYSTEGTQYAQNNSFYLLDSVPGAGAAIPGPVTIAGNLTVTGTTTLQGAAGATSLNTNSITAGPASATYAATGNLTVSSATQLSLVAPIVGVTASAGNLTLAGTGSGSITYSPTAGGSIIVASPALTLNGSTTATLTSALATVSSPLNGSLVAGPNILGSKVRLASQDGGLGVTANNGVLRLAATGNVAGTAGNVFITAGDTALQSLTLNTDAQNTSLGYGVEVGGKLNVPRGLSLAPGAGTFLAPAVATNVGGANQFNMLTNKAFITTSGAVGISMVVFFPTIGANFIPIIGQIGNTGTNIASTLVTGDSVSITPSNPLNPMTFYIAIV